jgi:predicted nucleic acid-binding protein
MVTSQVVVDASALVDLLLNNDRGARVANRVSLNRLIAPAHIDVEVLSAFARMERAGELSAKDVVALLLDAQAITVERHLLAGLAAGAWARHRSLRISDAFYVELADELNVPLITTDLRLARATPRAEAI